jgi:hypothetical protein
MDELGDILTLFSLKIVYIIKFVVYVQNWSILYEYHSVIELQVFVSKERQLYGLIAGGTVDISTCNSKRL